MSCVKQLLESRTAPAFTPPKQVNTTITTTVEGRMLMEEGPAVKWTIHTGRIGISVMLWELPLVATVMKMIKFRYFL